MTNTTKLFCIAGTKTCSEIHRIVNLLHGYSLIGSASDVSGTILEPSVIEAQVILIHNDNQKRDVTKIVNILRQRNPDAKLIILLSEENQFWSVLNTRSDAYLIWPSTFLINAIENVTSGVWLGPCIGEYLVKGDGFKLLQSVSSVIEMPKSIELLSNREKEVVKLLLEGMTNKQIAEALNLRLGTVKVHINHILGKLQLEHRGQAIARLSKLQFSC